jgi:hypothetical protein
MPDRVEVDPYVVLGLIVRKGGAHGDSVRAGGVEVVDLDVQVNHQ